MKKNNLDKKYWEDRYMQNKTGWDIGYPSPPLIEYINQLENKSLKILIPGAGNSYEAEYLWNLGFKNVFIVDIAKQPIDNLKLRLPNFPNDQLLNIDFFKIDQCFDLILEQTFFCALNPNLREAYAKQMHHLLKPNGKLVGLLFNFELTSGEPPYGGNEMEYKNLFETKFKIKTFQGAINSIKARQGKELFFIFEKKT